VLEFNGTVAGEIMTQERPPTEAAQALRSSSRLESSPSDSQEPGADPCRSSDSWWNPSKEAAAELVAAGELTIAEIAKRVGVSEKTIDRWKKRPEFQARVEGITANFRERLMAEMLAEIDRDYSEWLPSAPQYSRGLDSPR